MCNSVYYHLNYGKKAYSSPSAAQQYELLIPKRTLYAHHWTVMLHLREGKPMC